ncbi:MAG: hypothetical protein HC819_07865 [Cyclobacteriaceae bacterium]|nr:hypothetical protein [Cyclobacteriaceae bacterium]
MKPDFFWRSWEKSYKYLYQSLLLVFAGSIAAFVFSFFSGSSFVIDWTIDHLIHPVQELFSSYAQGPYVFPVYIDNFLIFEGFVASDLVVNNWPAYVLLVWLGLFVSIMLAMLSELPRFWFVVGVVFFTILFVGLRLDHLMLFNSYSKVGMLVAIVLYFPSLYIFHFVRPQCRFEIRLLTHVLATAIFAILIGRFSYVGLPFLHLANYGMYVPLALTVVFALMVGSEIVAALLRIVSSGTLMADGKSLVHFLAISVVFLLNVALVLLRNARMLDLNLYLIGAFSLLTIASVAGIWGYRHREPAYESVFPFAPFGAVLFICLAITAHITVAFSFATGNDSFVEAIEDAIVYSQLGFSAMFVAYVIANFFDLLRHNVDVARVLYKPRRMPYFISRFAGIVFVMALFFRFHMTPFYQVVAGYYSGIGDLYLKANDDLSAAEYYKLSNIYSGTSHRANYALATLEKRKGNATSEIAFLQQAIGKNPTAFAFANLASKYLEQKRLFEASFTLQDGLEHFPDHGILLNNLGLVYVELGNVDSAFFYFDRAMALDETKHEASANLYALLSRHGLSIKPDTLLQLWPLTDHLVSANNLVVLANQMDKPLEEHLEVGFDDPATETIEQLVYNYNKSLNNPSLADTVYLQQMNHFYDSGSTSWFQDNLHFSSALALFGQGNISRSFQMLNHLAIQNPDKQYYSLLGKLATKLRANLLAIDHYKNAFQNGNLEVAAALAFAYMEQGDLPKAAFVWRQISQNGDTTDRSMAEKMLAVMAADQIADVVYADAEIRFSFVYFRFREFDLSTLEGLVVSLDNEDLRALAFVRLVEAYLQLGQTGEALRLLQNLGQLSISRMDVLEAINLAQCQYAWNVRDEALMSQLQANLSSGDIMVQSYLSLFTHILSQNTNEQKSVASALKLQASRNPFFEEGVLEAVRVFNEKIDDKDQAYQLLLDAIRINPFSVQLNEAYAIQSLEIGLKSYAIEAKEALKTMMPSILYAKFEKDFNEKLVEIENKSGVW